MKRFLFLSASLMFCCAAQAQNRPEFADVEFSHWAYSATRKAAQWIMPREELGHISLRGLSNPPATRLEFSVVTAHLEDKLSDAAAPMATYDVHCARDIVAALHREFQAELSQLRFSN